MSRYVKDSNGNWQISAGLPQIDNELDSTSENPVQNKVVQTYFQSLTNQVKDMNNVYGSKNLLPNNIYGTISKNGVTISRNNDGSLNVSGTNTSSIVTSISLSDAVWGNNSAGELWLIDDYLDRTQTHIMSISNSSVAVRIRITFYNASKQAISGSAIDTTTRVTIEPSDIPSEAVYAIVRLAITAGVTVQADAVTYPMICLKSVYDLDPSYQPYAKTNQQLTEDTTALLDNTEVNGAVNMLPNNATTQTINGVTFTVNDDGTVTADGTATERAELGIYINTDGSPHLVGKTVKLSGCPSDGGESTYRLQAYRVGTVDGSSGTFIDTGDGIEFTWLNNNSGGKASVSIIVFSGVTVSNLVFKPMITVPSYNGDYVPYAKSNKELTEDVVNEYISSEFDSSNIITNHNLYAQRDGKNLYLYGWVELPAGTYNYGDDLFTIKHTAGVLNSILIGADLTNHSQSPIFMRILNRTNIVEMESPVTLSATTKIQFVATPIYLD